MTEHHVDVKAERADTSVGIVWSAGPGTVQKIQLTRMMAAIAPFLRECGGGCVVVDLLHRKFGQGRDFDDYAQIRIA
jgi:hypothetical protein